MSTKVKVEELDVPTQERLKSLFEGWEYARFGDGRYFMPASYKDDADKVVDMAVRPDDVWVATFPRSGTTWTQELVWLLKNDLDYDTAAKIPLMGRYVFIEVNHVLRPEKLCQKEMDLAKLQEFASTMPAVEAIANAPSPRYIKTHMPFSLLPPNLLDTTKVVYVARDPRDVAVSYYHHNQIFHKYSGDFKTYWNLFVNDLVLGSPFFTQLKEAWALRHHENMLFLFYEDMTATAEHKALISFLEMSTMIPRRRRHDDDMKRLSGGWREHFDEEMTTQAQRWLRDNLAGTDLRFPHDTC